VYLALINGVVGRNKELKYDNGALQVRLEGRFFVVYEWRKPMQMCQDNLTSQQPPWVLP
jgi:hypothetical protein